MIIFTMTTFHSWEFLCVSALLTLLASICLVTPVLADGGHDHHAVPTLNNQTATTVTIQDNIVTLTFGPIDLPAAHDGDLAASMPKHNFQLPKDMYMVGYKTAVFTKEGKPLPKNYLHHILMLNNRQTERLMRGRTVVLCGSRVGDDRDAFSGRLWGQARQG